MAVVASSTNNLLLPGPVKSSEVTQQAPKAILRRGQSPALRSKKRISTRLFLSRFSLELLSTLGLKSPKPSVLIRCGPIFNFSNRYFLTDSARSKG